MRKLLIISVLFCLAVQSSFAAPKPVIMELIVPKGATFRYDRFAADVKDFDATDIKQWHNHIIVYAKTSSVYLLKKKLSADCPNCTIHTFEKPFYQFDRSRCSDKNIAQQWDNIIMTAQLVKDPKMQQEYLGYHATQFQKWPEVSQGFCNAQFQQLLVFKSGRQLMLVISIPKGESLDKLNPLTSRNNPRVDDWNRMMAKYQEGIEGTKPGETWVLFKDIDRKLLNK